MVGCVDGFLNSAFRLLPTLRMLSAEFLQVRRLELISLDANFFKKNHGLTSLALRVEHLELIFIRLLHLLAHHPDFGTTKEELLDAAMYIVSTVMFASWKLTPLFISYVQFYLDLIATSENISLLYFLSFKGKSVRDSESHSGSEVR